MLCINASILGLIFLPVIASIPINTTLPPSNAGKGKIFITPKLIETATF